MTNQRWKHRPENSNWGDFGPDDQLGRLNLITPETRLKGVAEVRDGLSFCLALPLDYPGGNALNPRRHPPQLRPTTRENGDTNFNIAIKGATDVICDDLAILHLQYSTQWDALSHVGSQFDADGDGVAEHVFYNGYRGGEDVLAPQTPDGPSSANALGIEGMAAHGVQGRAVLIDLFAAFGNEHIRVGYDALMRVMEADNVSVESGDMVCLHTGFAQRVLEMNRKPDPEILHNSNASLDGRDGKLLNWITDSGLSALIADNYAVEAYPAGPSDVDCCATLPLHEHCLFKNGIHLGELWHLTPLANHLRAQGRSRFFLTAPPLRLPGAVGSPLTPIATV